MHHSGKNNTSPSDKGGDGVHITEYATQGSRSTLLYKCLALLLVGCCAFYFVTIVVDRASLEDGNSRANPSALDQSQLHPTAENHIGSSSSLEAVNTGNRQLVARPAQAYDRNDLSHYIAPGQTPKMEEVIERLHDAGIYSGLGAFNPPGTSPPMPGMAVPEDYVLPEGYVRHYQATDDGQRIEPILMYSPDFNFFDSAGRPIVIPDNRVVPDNMAPPGLVIRPIKIPEPLEPGGP